jgi:superfamily II DNA or RNA helicase
MERYITEIYERYLNLKKAGKSINKLDNFDLCKIFEYFTCIKLSEEYKRNFYQYDDIDLNFKEDNHLSKTDTGIDCCDLHDTIVQCKLRNKSLTWTDCATFFGSQTIFCEKENKPIIRWKNLIIARNSDSVLSDNLTYRSKLFVDKKYKRDDIINFCEELIKNPPKYPKTKLTNFIIRDYQQECINLIQSQKKNIGISLPTGTGKNVIIIHSLKENNKYLIFVPRIILMEQLKKEILIHKPELKNKIQLIGDCNDKYSEDIDITICVFNSITKITSDFSTFEKIFVDEAHHIDKPEIYQIENDDSESENDDSESENDDSESENDDSESESDDSDTYTKESFIKKIQRLSQYNNNVYLSATLDKIDGFEYYNKDIRDMIEQKYLCDYSVHIPIFSNNATNKNICEHLIKNYKNIIIYCNCQKEGKAINQLMNKILPNCSKYIDCDTPKKEREKTIDSYKCGTIPFLVNVKILVEGFDAPITKGVCFMHLPNSNNTVIQIIGRALRLHPQKNIANIILPFSTKEDEGAINKFLKIIARNDNRIKKSYMNKNLCGYITIDKVIKENAEIEKKKEDYNIENEEEDEAEFKFSLIYNSMGKLENYEEIWMDKLERVKKYIDENGKRPSSESDDKKIKEIGVWICTQTANYKKKKYIIYGPNL